VAFTDWCRARGYKGWLEEFGAANNSTALAALDDMLVYMADNSDVWGGWSYWAAGDWWGGYMFSVQPSGGTDKPQMPTLLAHAEAPQEDPGGEPDPNPEPDPDPEPDPEEEPPMPTFEVIEGSVPSVKFKVTLESGEMVTITVRWVNGVPEIVEAV
jgi:hypothetical protein